MRVLGIAEAGVVVVLLVVMVWQFRRQHARVGVRPGPDVGLGLLLDDPDTADPDPVDPEPPADPAPTPVAAREYEVPRILVPVAPPLVDDKPAETTRETWATPTALIGTRRVHRSCAEARRDGRVERVCALCAPVLTGGGGRG